MSDMKTKRLESGEVIPPGYFGELWDDINARTLSGDSKTVRVTRTPNGTTISAIPRPSNPPSGGGGGEAAALPLQFLIQAAKTEAGQYHIKITHSDYTGRAGVVRIGGGITYDMPTYDNEALTGGKRYLYLVMDVTKEDSEDEGIIGGKVYIKDSATLLYSTLNGSILLGTYDYTVTPGENGADPTHKVEITQALQTTQTVDLGPDYLGAYCLLPGTPVPAAPIPFIVNPIGGVELGAAGYTFNGSTLPGTILAEPATLSVARITITPRAYANIQNPIYSADENGNQIMTRPPQMFFSQTPEHDHSVGLYGYTDGIINVWWTDAWSVPLWSILFEPDNYLS